MGGPYIIVDYVPVWALFKSDTSTKLIAPKKCHYNKSVAFKSHSCTGQHSGNCVRAFLTSLLDSHRILRKKHSVVVVVFLCTANPTVPNKMRTFQ